MPLTSIDIKKEHDNVVRQIQADLSPIYNILSNLEKEQHFIADLFPDLIILDKKTNSPLFIMEVKRNGEIASCLKQWKSVKELPAILYIIVPENDFVNAKSIAPIIGIPVKIGTYKPLDEDGNVQIQYNT